VRVIVAVANALRIVGQYFDVVIVIDGGMITVNRPQSARHLSARVE